MYQMELVGNDARLVIDAVNQGIDAHLQAVTNSTFVFGNVGKDRLYCSVAPNDLRVIVRRLLESEDMESAMLVSSIGETLGIEAINLTRNDAFLIDYHDGKTVLVSVFDDQFWPSIVD